MKKISILIPCYNEEKSLPLLYPELVKLMDGNPAYEWELMFVNDGSRDDTLKVLQQLRQQDKRVNYVYAKRKTRGKESWLRKRLSLQFYKILQSSSRFDVLQNVGDFRLLDRCCINALKSLRESERYTKGMYSWIGFKKKDVEFEQGDRVAGESSWNYKQLFSFAIDGITSFTNAPLRISTVIGFVVSLFAFLYMIYVFIKSLIWGDPVQGYPTLVILILFLGGIQLLSLGIIGEYIGRIYNETKNRPDYIVREFNDEKVK